MAISTIEWADGKIKLIDQTLLPNEFKQIYCEDLPTVWEAIKSLRVRGAPAIGIAAALGTVLGTWNSTAETTMNSQLNSNQQPIILQPHVRQQ